MEPRHIEKAAAFCKLVGNSNLVEYLGLDPSTASSAACRAKLKDRRKYMQGMQSNPKYKSEAVFLIKNFRALDSCLESLPEYLDAVRKDQESENLPIVEMTIRTVLKGGQMGADQKDYLLKQAADLGVGNETFETILHRLAAEAGVPLPGEAPLGKEDQGTDVASGAKIDPSQVEDEYYVLLGVHNGASRDEVYNAYRQRHEEARMMEDKAAATRLLIQLDRAWKILGDPDKRRLYDLGRKRTGPPARDREIVRGNTSTAPPARHRGADIDTAQLGETTMSDKAPDGGGGGTGSGTPRLEVIGNTNRTIELASLDVFEESILIRNSGDGQMPGRVSTNVPWLVPAPKVIDATRKEQVLVIRIDPNAIAGEDGLGTVTVQTDHGDRATIQFSIIKPMSRLPIFIGMGLIAIAALAVLGLALGGVLFNTDASLIIQIDPTAEKVVFDGQDVGSGSVITIDQPKLGKSRLEITQANFKPFITQIDVVNGDNVVPIELELARPLDFKPRADLKQATLDGDFVERIMVPRSRAMDDCVRRVETEGNLVEGTVRIHVGPDGLPMGVKLDGDGSDNPDVRDCLTRQAAAALFHPFKDGDYATVRYNYKVSEAAP